MTMTPPSWPSFQGNAQFVGTSPSGRVTVYVDASLGQPGLQNAQDLLKDADRVAQANDAIFGTKGEAVRVIVFAMSGKTDGTGGADHGGCDYKSGDAIEVCASFNNSARVSALFEAELSECCMNGNLCGESTGEALSRWCAAVVGSNALADFVTAPTWAKSGMPNWIDRVGDTDQDDVSIGCGMAFLSWLLSTGRTLSQIAQAMVSLGDKGTLAQLYEKLTGDAAANAWLKFYDAVTLLPHGITSDDPFGGAPQGPQSPPVAPLTVAAAGTIFASILTDLAAGKTAQQIVSNVQAIITAQGKQAAGAPAAKHPLLPPKKP